MKTEPENLAELTMSAKRQSRHGDGEGQLTVDVFTDNGDIIIQSTIAGVGADEIDIALTKDRVTIKGVRQSADRVKTDDYYHRELHWGAFSRSIILPEEIDPDKAKATLKNGLLTLRLPKLSTIKTKKLKIAS